MGSRSRMSMASTRTSISNLSPLLEEKSRSSSSINSTPSQEHDKNDPVGKEDHSKSRRKKGSSTVNNDRVEGSLSTHLEDDENDPVGRESYSTYASASTRGTNRSRRSSRRNGTPETNDSHDEGSMSSNSNGDEEGRESLSTNASASTRGTNRSKKRRSVGKSQNSHVTQATYDGRAGEDDEDSSGSSSSEEEESNPIYGIEELDSNEVNDEVSYELEDLESAE